MEQMRQMSGRLQKFQAAIYARAKCKRKRKYKSARKWKISSVPALASLV